MTWPKVEVPLEEAGKGVRLRRIYRDESIENERHIMRISNNDASVPVERTEIDEVAVRVWQVITGLPSDAAYDFLLGLRRHYESGGGPDGLPEIARRHGIVEGRWRGPNTKIG